MSVRLPNFVALTVLTVAAVVAATASAQKAYDPGASDAEFKVDDSYADAFKACSRAWMIETCNRAPTCADASACRDGCVEQYLNVSQAHCIADPIHLPRNLESCCRVCKQQFCK